MINFNFKNKIFTNSSTGQFILDSKGMIIEANESFQAMVDDECKGKSLIDFIFHEDVDSWNFAFENFFSEDMARTHLNVRYEGFRKICWWKLYLDKVDVYGESYILGVVIDISGEIESQGDLLEAKKAAEKSEQSKSIFLANMSHEIRTPIHTVTGLTELLENTELDSEQTEYVSQIGFAAKVLLTLINDILDFSKIEAGKLTFESIEYNLYETLNNSVDLSALEAHKKGVDVAISFDPKMPMFIVGDQVRLRQIIVNLMSNAVKFTQKGEIILTVECHELDDGRVSLKVSVCDSGIGISKEKQSKLFKAFSQADTSTTRQFGGTGLGLSISSSLVQMMGGQISVTSEEGKGACFTFEIPVIKGSTNPPLFVEPPVKGLKALVVDDNRKVNKIFSQILKDWGYEVVEVYNGMDALNELIIKASMGNPYDLCFIDQILPGMDGWQLASEIHSNNLIKPTKTLLMSLKAKGIEESKMKLLGWFQGYLTKPVTKVALYHALNELYIRTTDHDLELDSDEIEDLEEVDELEELEELEELDPSESKEPYWVDDDDLEPLEVFSEEDYDMEELVPVDESNYIEDVKNFKTMNNSIPEEESDLLQIISDDRKKILVVEDHLVNQKLFKVILEKEGFLVLTANDGQEAVEVVESERPDMIFMDCQMPVMNGYDSSRKIREDGYTSPIVAVTASAMKDEYEKCIGSGMNDVMTKPFKKEDVVASIAKWINKKRVSKVALFDYDKALERFMGEKEILLDVLGPYKENLLKLVNELKGIDLSNHTRVREIAHGIKGSSLNLDIVPLGKEAEKLEDFAYDGKEGEFQGLIQSISKLSEDTVKELSNYLS